jgi:hypothetical protein
MKLQCVELSGRIKLIVQIICVFFLSVGVISAQAEVVDVYSQDVKRIFTEMTTVECAQCHYEIFMSIKNGKGAHRLECQACHKTYHSFRQGGDYKVALPTCDRCHAAPHGKSKQMLNCKGCHTVPHAPVASLDLAILEPDCVTCHTEPGARMQSGNSKHTKLKCVICHSDEHGYIPSCKECHGIPHSQELIEEFVRCLNCHGNPHDLSLITD